MTQRSICVTLDARLTNHSYICGINALRSALPSEDSTATVHCGGPLVLNSVRGVGRRELRFEAMAGVKKHLQKRSVHVTQSISDTRVVSEIILRQRDT
jgi:hypothetical protein